MLQCSPGKVLISSLCTKADLLVLNLHLQPNECGNQLDGTAWACTYSNASEAALKSAQRMLLRHNSSFLNMPSKVRANGLLQLLLSPAFSLRLMLCCWHDPDCATPCHGAQQGWLWPGPT